MQWNYNYENPQPSGRSFDLDKFSSYFDVPQLPCQCIKLRDCTPYIELAKHSSAYRPTLGSLRSRMCGFEGTDVKVCCPQFNQKRRRDSFPFGRVTSEEPWIWDVEETTKPPHRDDDDDDNLNNRFGPTEYSFHDFLKPHRTEFGDLDSRFNELHNFKRKPPHHPHRKHDILFHFEDPETFKNCPPPISNEFELPDDFKHVTSPIIRDPVPVLPMTVSEDSETNTEQSVTVDREKNMELVNTEYCGISVNTRIIGGEDAGPGQFPWMARLAYRNKSECFL